MWSLYDKDFFLGFICNGLSYFTTVKISFTSTFLRYNLFKHTLFSGSPMISSKSFINLDIEQHKYFSGSNK